MNSHLLKHSRIGTRYRIFSKTMADIWESYNLVHFYMDRAHELVKHDQVPVLSFTPLQATTTKTLNKKDLYGAIAHLTQKANPRRALIDAVATFENYLGDLTFFVCMDYPGKLKSGGVESDERRDALISIIINSAGREEMIERLAEEKIRGIFYGNPVEFFEKDRAKLEFGDHFKVNHASHLTQFAEIVARRNVFAHNDGRVDRKYQREVRGTKFSLGEAVQLDAEYLRRTVTILRGLAAVASALVLERVYKVPVRGSVASAVRSFSKFA